MLAWNMISIFKSILLETPTSIFRHFTADAQNKMVELLLFFLFLEELCEYFTVIISPFHKSDFKKVFLNAVKRLSKWKRKTLKNLHKQSRIPCLRLYDAWFVGHFHESRDLRQSEFANFGLLIILMNLLLQKQILKLNFYLKFRIGV